MSGIVCLMTASVQETPAQTQPWIPGDDTFGARLALVRWRMGWNMKEAALAVRVPAATWRLWEVDNAQPRNLVEIAERIAERVGCDFDWLLRGQRIPGRQGRQTTERILAVTGQPRSARRGKVSTQPSGPFPTSAPGSGFPRTARVPRNRVHQAA